MGGSPNLLMPVNPAYTASWLSHTHRSPRSSEPGTDLFVPIGTPVLAPADGWIYGYGESIDPPTGRWVGINFDNGMKGRGMHFSRLVRRDGYVRRGDLIAYSGASGYGHEDWSHLSGMPGAHVHWSMWEEHNPPQLYGYRPNGLPWTVDLMQYVGGDQTAGEAPKPKEWDEMATEEQIRAIVRDEVERASRAGAFKIVGVAPGNMYLTGPGGGFHLSSKDDLNLMRRWIKALPYVDDDTNGEETFTDRQKTRITRILASMKPLD